MENPSANQDPPDRNKLLVPVLALIGGGLLIAYLQFRPGNGGINGRDSASMAPADIEKTADSYDAGVFKAYVAGDDPQVIIEDANGKSLTFSCVAGCPPLDQMPDHYVGQRVKIYWSSPGTWIYEAGETTAPKTILQVDILQ